MLTLNYIGRCALSLVKVLAGVGVVWVIYWCRGQGWVRIYPVVITGAVLTGFVWSLRPGGMPLVERFARRMERELLDERGVVYCRRVTWAWVFFLTGHLGVTVATLWFPLRVWAVYNGLVAYLLMGAMFIGEWLVRRRVRRERRN